jgi:hypothetical protein
MRRGLIAAATVITMMLAGGLLWNANASPMGVPLLPNYSPVQTIGCTCSGRSVAVLPIKLGRELTQ